MRLRDATVALMVNQDVLPEEQQRTLTEDIMSRQPQDNTTTQNDTMTGLNSTVKLMKDRRKSKLKDKSNAKASQSKTSDSKNSFNSRADLYMKDMKLKTDRAGRLLKIVLVISYVIAVSLGFVYLNLIAIEEEKLADALVFLDHIGLNKNYAMEASIAAKKYFNQ